MVLWDGTKQMGIELIKKTRKCMRQNYFSVPLLLCSFTIVLVLSLFPFRKPQKEFSYENSLFLQYQTLFFGVYAIRDMQIEYRSSLQYRILLQAMEAAHFTAAKSMSATAKFHPDPPEIIGSFPIHLK